MAQDTNVQSVEEQNLMMRLLNSDIVQSVMETMNIVRIIFLLMSMLKCIEFKKEKN